MRPVDDSHLGAGYGSPVPVVAARPRRCFYCDAATLEILTPLGDTVTLTDRLGLRNATWVLVGAGRAMKLTRSTRHGRPEHECRSPSRTSSPPRPRVSSTVRSHGRR